jgi:hypothetical protein
MAPLSHVSPDSPFTIDNIPFGVFSTKDDPTPRCATAIGEFAVDLRALSSAGFFSDVDDVDAVTHALSQVRMYVRTYVTQSAVRSVFVPVPLALALALLAEAGRADRWCALLCSSTIEKQSGAAM